MPFDSGVMWTWDEASNTFPSGAVVAVWDVIADELGFDGSIAPSGFATKCDNKDAWCVPVHSPPTFLPTTVRDPKLIRTYDNEPPTPMDRTPLSPGIAELAG
jgi:hypothetical protein